MQISGYFVLLEYLMLIVDETEQAYYQNDIKHGMQKSKPQSKQAPFCTTFLHKTFSLFQHHSILFETTLLMKTNIDQWSNYTLMQR
jgi:hypothetical protein